MQVGVGEMQVRWLQIGDFQREALSVWLSRNLITRSVRLACLQHIHRDAARRVGLSATADPLCFLYPPTPLV